MVGQFIKHFHGAYKYAITQTFAIPTIDDAERDTIEINSDKENILGETTEQQISNENTIEEMLENPSVDDFDSIFKLGQKSA